MQNSQRINESTFADKKGARGYGPAITAYGEAAFCPAVSASLQGLSSHFHLCAFGQLGKQTFERERVSGIREGIHAARLPAPPPHARSSRV